MSFGDLIGLRPVRTTAVTLVAALAWLAAPSCARANVMVVNRDTGGIVWLNATGQVLFVAAYTLQSPSGGFRPADWLSISEHYDADSGGALDPNHVWTVLGRSGSDLSEATIGTTAFRAGSLVDLGTPWAPGHVEDVTFEYFDAGLDQVLPGTVLFVSDVPGDFNANGLVEQEDLDLVLSNWGKSAEIVPLGWFQDFPQDLIDQRELDRVLVNWGVLGRTGPHAGTGALQAASIPEPPAIVLSMVSVLSGIAALKFSCQIRQCSSTSAGLRM